MKMCIYLFILIVLFKKLVSFQNMRFFYEAPQQLGLGFGYDDNGDRRVVYCIEVRKWACLLCRTCFLSFCCFIYILFNPTEF